jgi:hypothetical protein
MKFAACILALFLASPAVADTYFGGIEDAAGSHGFEGTGDFNDLIFSITGDVTVNAPGAAFRSLTPKMANESGSLYFGNRSLDGADFNIAYCLLGDGSCHIAVTPSSVQYLAEQQGAAPMGIEFHAIGAVTFGLLLKETSNYNGDTLGWYDPADPADLHMIFAGPTSTSTSATVMLNGDFVLFSGNGLGQFYSSVAAANVGESTTQQHFALFQETAPVAAPEPASLLLVGFALIAMILPWIKISRAKDGRE